MDNVFYYNSITDKSDVARLLSLIAYPCNSLKRNKFKRADTENAILYVSSIFESGNCANEIAMPDNLEIIFREFNKNITRRIEALSCFMIILGSWARRGHIETESILPELDNSCKFDFLHQSRIAINWKFEQINTRQQITVDRACAIVSMENRSDYPDISNYRRDVWKSALPVIHLISSLATLMSMSEYARDKNPWMLFIHHPDELKKLFLMAEYRAKWFPCITPAGIDGSQLITTLAR